MSKVRQQFNKWLVDEFQGKVYLALDSSEAFPIKDIATKQFAEHWSKATKDLAKYKSRKLSITCGRQRGKKLPATSWQRSITPFQDETGQTLEYWRVEKADSVIILPIHNQQ